MKQRSIEWFEARRGRITASPVYKILTDGTRPMTKAELVRHKEENPKSRKKTTTCIGDMLYTYAFEKAIELVYGVEEEEINSPDITRGVNLEPPAFEIFKEIKDKEFIEVQEASFFPYGKDAGASPDGLVGSDAVLEIKCPRSTKFFNLVMHGEKMIDPKYYDQMQMQMLCTKSKQAHFFNYIEYNGQPMWHEIIVGRDEQRIALIKERIGIAARMRDQYAEQLIKNQQFSGTDRELAKMGRTVL